MLAATPDAALMRWVQSVPAVRCVAPAFRAWTGAKDAAVVKVTPTSGERFANAGFAGNVIANLTVVAGGGSNETYWMARVPPAHTLVLHAGSEAQEDSFTAILAAPAALPPRTIAMLAHGPRAHGLTVGSTRAEVERVLGPGHATSLCGYDVVRYEPQPAQISISEMWFFYSDNRVVAITQYEAV